MTLGHGFRLLLEIVTVIIQTIEIDRMRDPIEHSPIQTVVRNLLLTRRILDQVGARTKALSEVRIVHLQPEGFILLCKRV